MYLSDIADVIIEFFSIQFLFSSQPIIPLEDPWSTRAESEIGYFYFAFRSYENIIKHISWEQDEIKMDFHGPSVWIRWFGKSEDSISIQFCNTIEGNCVLQIRYWKILNSKVHLIGSENNRKWQFIWIRCVVYFSFRHWTLRKNCEIKSDSFARQ